MSYAYGSPAYFMHQALMQAEMAYEKDEVPVGAVIVVEGQIIAKAHNQVEQLHDATAHAEMLAITAASGYLNSKYLTDCSLFVTLEPCFMCGGALAWSQIGHVFYGTSDPKKGLSTLEKAILHPKTTFMGGILQAECQALLKSFFQEKRK